jgi:LytS/YehU family sensor histidine kinase
MVGGVKRYFMGGFTVWPAIISNVIIRYISEMVYTHYELQPINSKLMFITAGVCENIVLQPLN